MTADHLTSGRYEVNVGGRVHAVSVGLKAPVRPGQRTHPVVTPDSGGLPRRAGVTRLDGVTGTPTTPPTPGDRSGPRPGRATPPPGWPGPGRRSPAGCGRCWRPTACPPGASAELESALGDIGREALAPGPGRLRRIRAEVAAAPPRLLDWMSTQVIDHPAVVYDVAGVEELTARQTKSIQAAVGALQLALVGAASASTLEGGPVLALAIDGVVGQVAAVVHGVCDWYNTGSYLVRRLDGLGTAGRRG